MALGTRPRASATAARLARPIDTRAHRRGAEACGAYRGRPSAGPAPPTEADPITLALRGTHPIGPMPIPQLTPFGRVPRGPRRPAIKPVVRPRKPTAAGVKPAKVRLKRIRRPRI